MSYKKSSLYASRVFSDHPIALWAMDEDYSFLSILSESEKTFNYSSFWSLNNGSIVEEFEIPFSSPIDLGLELESKIFLSNSSQRFFQIDGEELEYSKFNVHKDTVAISCYVYIPEGISFSRLEIGIGHEEKITTSTYRNLIRNRWHKISHTSKITEESGIRPLVKVYFTDDDSEGEESTGLYFSSISIGQWSEQFNGVSTGSISENLPENVVENLTIPNVQNIKYLPIDSYGFNDSNFGYAVEYKKQLLIESNGIPMVYGSKGNINILSNNEIFFENFIDFGTFSEIDFEEGVFDGGSPDSLYTESLDGGDVFYTSVSQKIPSLFFPGKGFLNDFGKYKSITTEFWARINNESVEEIKIFGPLASKDGIYVEKDFITVKVGKYIKSYFVGQWYRPMLVHFSQSESEISLMINAEKVISIKIDSLDSIQFPTIENDYIGFYGNKDVDPFEIDCVSIFPYVVSEQQAKIRYVYGQGVEEQDIVVQRFGGDVAYADFPFAGYNSTVSYPDRNFWTGGYSNNLNVDTEGLSMPSYTLPDLRYSFDTEVPLTQLDQDEIFKNFEKDNFEIQDEEYPFISMYPNLNYEDSKSLIYFSNLNKLSLPVKSISGIFKASEDVVTDQLIMKFFNEINGDYLDIKVSSGSLSYYFNDVIFDSKNILENEYFSAGVNLELVTEKYYSVFKNFFNNPESISLSIMGDGENTFKGKMFSLTFNNKFFLQKDMLDSFDQNGISNKTFNEYFYKYVGAYTLLPKLSNETVFLDIGAQGYWEESLPMSFFGRNVKDEKGRWYYDLDLIQFNIDIPSTVYVSNTDGSIKYGEETCAKTYLTFENILTVGDRPFTDYQNTEIIEADRVIDLDYVIEDILDTRYKVFDGTIIFPPSGQYDFSKYYVTVHILLNSKGINTENISIKKMSMSSLVFDNEDFYAINTPTSAKIYPVAKVEDQYVYEEKKPVLINNESAPYLYLSKDSGLTNIPDKRSSLLKGISIPLNQEKKGIFTLTGIQMFLMYNEDEEFLKRKIIGKVITVSRSYDIVLIPEDSKKRAYIKVFDSNTKVEKTEFKYYLNGKLVSDLIIKPKSWNHIGISLEQEALNISGQIGQIEIYSGVCVNNVGTFKQFNTISTNITVSNEWINVLADLDEDGIIVPPLKEWSWLLTGPESWLKTLDKVKVGEELSSLNVSIIFDSYSGVTSNVVVDETILSIDFDSYSVINDVSWLSFDSTPI